MSLVSDAKEMAGLIKKIGNLDLYRKMVELQGEIVDFQSKIVEKEEKIEESKKEISRLRNAMKIKKKVIRYGDYVFEKNKKGKPTGNPYCLYCWEYNHLLISVLSTNRRELGYEAKCPHCKNTTNHFYSDPEAEE